MLMSLMIYIGERSISCLLTMTIQKVRMNFAFNKKIEKNDDSRKI